MYSKVEEHDHEATPGKRVVVLGTRVRVLGMRELGRVTAKAAQGLGGRRSKLMEVVVADPLVGLAHLWMGILNQ